ncbi:uncharacterized protein LOC106057155 [Biomphalaria glabrata]|uniref:Uncharacterized protein LOC106057155 n=1 Tax=Biomphalaria glabrata TaxID=6526 RepID=A0A9W2YZL1_BIOGL|nr:uncharacterized protein LOC106057155 [Biomphalaria glabrata]XP_055868143.1 uncharacterized protein LOC106057155 [Biomphalaria glabrata]
MELMKQFLEAKSCGVSTEEFFKLIEAELQLQQMKSTAQPNTSINAASSDSKSDKVSSPDIDLTYEKLGHNDSYLSFKREIEDMFQRMRSDFQELKSSILSSLQEEKYMMRDQLGEAQKEINSRLTLIESDVQRIKETVSSLQKQGIDSLCMHKQTMLALGKISTQTPLSSNLGQPEGPLTNKLADVENQLKEIPDQLTNIKESLDETQVLLQDSMVKQFYESNRKFKESLNQLKKELFDVTEKEGQLVRDRLSSPAQPRKHYICDFYVPQFRDKIKSSVIVYSPPWHIEPLSSSVKGLVEFNENADCSVWLVHGRHPREMGLNLRISVQLDVVATIMDIRGHLPNRLVGHALWDCNEAKIRDNSYWGELIGVLPCWEIIGKGYGKEEGYDDESLLIRFDIHVLEI